MSFHSKDSREPLSAIAAAFDRFEVRDLTHILEEGIPCFPTHSRFYHLDASRSDDPAVMFQILMHEHNGTHVDAPAHFMSGVPNPDHDFLHSVPPEKLIGPAAVIDVSKNPPHLLTVESLLKWEKANGAIEPGEAVIFNFGWHRKWQTGIEGKAFVEQWPGLDRGIAKCLLDRRVGAVGTDCLGLDCSGSAENPAHDCLLRNGILIMENMAALNGTLYEKDKAPNYLKVTQGSAAK
jgi:kynurenine formamidase